MTGGMVLVIGSAVFLITRRRKQAGKWLLVGVLIAGGVGLTGTSYAQNRGFDLFQHESLKDGIYTINVDVNANYVQGTSETEDKPGTSETEDKPGTSETEDKPGTSETEEKPGTSETEDKPGTSETEDKPGTSETEDKPGTSETEEKPEEQTSLEVKDSEIKVGDSWTAADNFVSATDKDGKEVVFGDITVEGTVDTMKCGEYPVVYTNDTVTKTATITVAPNPNAPVENPDGSISFVGKEWDVIKDYGDGTKMIAMQDKIVDSKFNPEYYFNTNEDTLDGYQNSLVKPIIDGWYNDTIAGPDYEQFIEPVSLPNPTLGTVKGISADLGEEITNENFYLDTDVWNQEINDPSKYSTIVGSGEKQAFLMSGSDVTVDAYGNISQAAISHSSKLEEKGVYFSWLRSPGSDNNYAAALSAGNVLVDGNNVGSTYSVVPSLVVHVPTCG
ncbi:hypothetical protein D5668_13170 [Enterococcus faecalis]|nr:hypothetical protein [Enterococcus faecalis]